MKKTNASMMGWFFTMLTVCSLILLPALADAKGSFGGSRGGGGGRSFGGSRGGSSRSYSRPSSPSYSRPSSPSTSFGRSSSPTPRSSFRGNRLNSSSDYTRSYGIPRQSTRMALPNGTGANQNYVVHNYGGRGDGFMMGYMMGSIPFMWHTPFHPAYYYSRPSYVTMPDGSVEVYPPTFSYSTLIFTLLVGGLIVYIIVRIIRSRSRAGTDYSNSSFS
ncbi:MAG: hypothetical protein HYZ54_02815 [Ignavibacteriae bacterium]|nr:hypothetical protein [Ignavibacteriota bacterium]